MYRLRIGYLTSNDATDRRSWSGTQYYMARALQRHCGDVTYLGPLRRALELPQKAFARAFRAVSGKTYLYTHSTSTSRRLARLAEQKLKNADLDLIFAPAGAAEIAQLNTDLPIVYLSDATLALMQSNYPEFSSLLASSLRQAHATEQAAIRKARTIIYPSRWAAASAVKDYGASPEKIHIAPFGANFEIAPERDTVLDRAVPDRPRLLFIGTEWWRKGGDIAYDALLELRRRNIPAHLTILGAKPPKNISHPAVTVVPFVNKNDPDGRKFISDLILGSSFLLLPSRSECSAIVLCEACAFGLPVLASAAGGTPEIVQSGKNGYVLPVTATGVDYADAICERIQNEDQYIELRKGSRAAFEERLNWDAWARTVGPILAESARLPITQPTPNTCGGMVAST